VIDTSLLVEGPIGGDWSAAVGGRRSYVDAVLPAMLKTFAPEADALAFTVAPRYYDYQLKAEHRPQGRQEPLRGHLLLVSRDVAVSQAALGDDRTARERRCAAGQLLNQCSITERSSTAGR
jgi:hypothetical protein